MILAIVPLNLFNFNQVWTGEWLVTFKADWCGYCQKFALDMKVLDRELKDVTIGTVDVDSEFCLSSRFMVNRLPTVFLIRQGKVFTYEGQLSSESIKFFALKEAKKKEPWEYPNSWLGIGLSMIAFPAQMLIAVTKWGEQFMPKWAVYTVLGVLFLLTLGGSMFIFSGEKEKKE